MTKKQAMKMLWLNSVVPKICDALVSGGIWGELRKRGAHIDVVREVMLEMSRATANTLLASAPLEEAEVFRALVPEVAEKASRLAVDMMHARLPLDGAKHP